MDTRRRLPRQIANWPGTYRFEDDPNVAEGTCRVVDISRIGAGFELFGDTPIDPIQHRIAVDVHEPGGGSIGVHLAGPVRNITIGTSGGVRVGIEFVGLTEMEQRVLESLEQMQLAW